MSNIYRLPCSIHCRDRDDWLPMSHPRALPRTLFRVHCHRHWEIINIDWLAPGLINNSLSYCCMQGKRWDGDGGYLSSMKYTAMAWINNIIRRLSYKPNPKVISFVRMYRRICNWIREPRDTIDCRGWGGWGWGWVKSATWRTGFLYGRELLFSSLWRQWWGLSNWLAETHSLTHSGQGVITLEVVVVLMGKVCTLVVQGDMWRSGQ